MRQKSRRRGVSSEDAGTDLRLVFEGVDVLRGLHEHEIVGPRVRAPRVVLLGRELPAVLGPFGRASFAVADGHVFVPRECIRPVAVLSGGVPGGEVEHPAPPERVGEVAVNDRRGAAACGEGVDHAGRVVGLFSVLPEMRVQVDRAPPGHCEARRPGQARDDRLVDARKRDQRAEVQRGDEPREHELRAHEDHGHRQVAGEHRDEREHDGVARGPTRLGWIVSKLTIHRSPLGARAVAVEDRDPEAQGHDGCHRHEGRIDDRRIGPIRVQVRRVDREAGELVPEDGIARIGELRLGAVVIEVHDGAPETARERRSERQPPVNGRCTDAGSGLRQGLADRELQRQSRREHPEHEHRERVGHRAEQAQDGDAHGASHGRSAGVGRELGDGGERDRERDEVVEEPPRRGEREQHGYEETRVRGRSPEAHEQPAHRPRGQREGTPEEQLSGELDRHGEREDREHEVHEPVVREEVHLEERVLGRGRGEEPPRHVGEREVFRIVDAGQEPGDEEAADRERHRAREERRLDPPGERSPSQSVPSSGSPALSNAQYAPWCERSRTAFASSLNTRLRTRGSLPASVGRSSGVLTMTSGNARAYLQRAS